MTSSITSNPTFATGDTIEAVFANNLRDSDLVLDARTGGDPGVAGLFLASSGALGGAWRVLATGDYPDGSVTDVKMANQKLSLSGGTLTGPLHMTAGQAVTLGGGGSMSDTAGVATFLFAANDLLVFQNQANNLQILNINPSQFLYKGQGVIHAGNIASQTVLAASTAPSGITFSGGGQIRDDSTTQTAVYANGNAFVMAKEDGSAEMAKAATTAFTILGNIAWHAGNDGSGSTLDADLWRGSTPAAITVGNASAVGGFTPGNSAGNIPVSSGAGTTNIGLSAQFVNGKSTSNATGDIPLSNGTKNVNLHADKLDGADASATPTASTIPIADGSNHLALGWLSGITDVQFAAANIDGTTSTASLRTLGTGSQQAAAGDHTHAANARIHSGTFSGNNSTQTISGVGFTPADVTITDDNGALIAFIQNGKLLSFPAGGASAATTVTINSDGWAFANAANGANTSGHTYHYTAIG